MISNSKIIFLVYFSIFVFHQFDKFLFAQEEGIKAIHLPSYTSPPSYKDFRQSQARANPPSYKDSQQFHVRANPPSYKDFRQSQARANPPSYKESQQFHVRANPPSYKESQQFHVRANPPSYKDFQQFQSQRRLCSKKPCPITTPNPRSALSGMTKENN